MVLKEKSFKSVYLSMSDKKTPKEASDLFHKIMKISVIKGLVNKPKKEVKPKEPKLN